MTKITNKEYRNVSKFFERIKFENIRQYVECYLKIDILLLSDCFNHFRKLMFDQFKLDCLKYTSSPSYTRDCCLLSSKCKIETF